MFSSQLFRPGLCYVKPVAQSTEMITLRRKDQLRVPLERYGHLVKMYMDAWIHQNLPQSDSISSRIYDTLENMKQSLGGQLGFYLFDMFNKQFQGVKQIFQKLYLLDTFFEEIQSSRHELLRYSQTMAHILQQCLPHTKYNTMRLYLKNYALCVTKMMTTALQHKYYMSLLYYEQSIAFLSLLADHLDRAIATS